MFIENVCTVCKGIKLCNCQGSILDDIVAALRDIARELEVANMNNTFVGCSK